MSHNHGTNVDYDRAFAIGICLNLAYIVIEAVFGVLTGSLALLADAGHNLSDVLGLVLAWGAHYLSKRPPTQRRTYGLRSSSILAALFNALLLLVALGGIAWEAIHRFWTPRPVSGPTVMWVAGVGVLVNGLTALLFVKGRKNDLNIQGAFLHMAADAGISVAVVVAGLCIFLSGADWIDPVTSLAVTGVILIGTWGLLRDSVNLALHAVPTHIDVAEVKNYLTGLPGVETVHDLHVWAMSTTETALTAHLVRPIPSGNDSLLAQATHELHHRFGIAHVTIQIEHDVAATQCRQVPDNTV